MNRWAWTGVLLLALGIGSIGCDSDGGGKPAPTVRTYVNPIALPDEWGEYGLGDPYVFSYNGDYYLYVSTRDTDAGVKVWRSPNLIDWTYEGLCTEDPVTTGAYAPEVRYWNGKFYMYTSPAGQGHYVLVSDKPTGPFTVATDNFGRTIDGSTFVDDDGQWYFYYAGPMGIQAAPMTDPLTVASSEAQTGAYMGGWTEGPTVFKRGGKYYMTYTGNHVFNNGYRVDVAVSDNPLQGFEGQRGNPALLRSEGATVGLGHNSVVTGPDLDTQYIVYHNLEGHGVVGPLRHMNLDRIVWSGDRLQVAGPTSEPQLVPAQPAFSERFEGKGLGKAWKSAGTKAKWEVDPAAPGLLADASGASKPGVAMLLAKPDTEERYTAEFHLQHLSGGQGKAGIVFSYRNADNYGLVTWNAENSELEAKLVRDGEEVRLESAAAHVPDNLDVGELQALRIEAVGKTVRVYLAEMKLLTLELPAPAGAGRIGYAVEGAKARFGYVAFSNHVDGSGAGDAYAPLPGQVDAVHAEGEGGKAEALGVVDDGNGGLAAAGLDANTPLTYRVNVAKGGVYSLRFRVRAGSEGVRFDVTEDDESNGESGGGKVASNVEAKPESGTDGWQTVSVNGVRLTEGMHRWTVKAAEGRMDLAGFEAAPYTPVVAREDDFSQKLLPGWTRFEGMWSVQEGEVRASSAQNAKLVTGEEGWTDYEIQADITVPAAGGQSGIVVRATEPANGLELNQNRNDFIRGYFAYVDQEGVHLVKHNYDTVPLADAKLAMPKDGGKVHLRVRAAGGRISVFIGNADAPVIDYADNGAGAFLNGKVALKSVDTATRFSSWRIDPIQ
ncbi:family 43 glycosylhydrolase [Paenibacillus kobensis]|uniref:family 43 glycosylhydrolase n=1 Tax=Paenibacillus kobensis TaxID=59841 RepID=UPI000FD89C5B|nr:family 43 glycosylhydrolase [Paenibacillus kobensis]